MKNKPFIHDFLFRLSFPLLWSVMIYILILLILGNLNNLSELYSIKEQSLCVFISFALFEFLRLFNILTERIVSNQSRKLILWFASIPISLSICFLIIYISLHFYFTTLLGYKVYTQELYFFTVFYLFSALFYNLLYVSIYFQSKQNKQLIEKEINKQKITVLEIENMINQVNTNFLFTNLELISIKSLHHPEEAENIIKNISDIYRYRFQHSNNSILLTKEIDIIRKYVEVVNETTNNSIKLNIEYNTEYDNIDIPHEILLGYIENLVNTFIITHEIPLFINILIKENTIDINNNLNTEKILSKNIMNTINFWKIKFENTYFMNINSSLYSESIETSIKFIK